MYGSLLRARFVWLPTVGLLFGAVLVGVGWLPIGGGLGIVVAGLLTVFAVLAVGTQYGLFR
ncbi:hypothetical protein M0R89_16760 [Halorussus limi]|uniref:Uncharacterized protein n=1 Tax=Halorussus limi TaxID=2938695 RepID=A0A8U0HTF4_9EURY|nr:hypothetical protein [Halorussus limi]UPV74178.1 hypothetical protein M0R89_16760 [Halorussus limi]